MFEYIDKYITNFNEIIDFNNDEEFSIKRKKKYRNIFLIKHSFNILFRLFIRIETKEPSFNEEKISRDNDQQAS